MSDTPTSSNSPVDASFDAFEPMVMSSSDPVLGYPETEPSSIDLGPVPNGVGAKPSAKSASIDTNAKSSQPRPARPANRKPESRSGPPLPKRPKGRVFIGSVFLVVIFALGFTLFNTLLRYSAYGEVVGRRLELAVPWPGVIESIHVREGDLVRFGEIIARIDNLSLRQRMEEIDDELRLQRAQLTSDLAMLRWEAEKIRDRRALSESEFYDKWSELLWEQSKFADLKSQVRRLESIHDEGAASEEQLQSLRYQFAGQEKRIEQLTEAVRSLKTRADESPIELDLEDRVRPTLARIENLQAELVRTRKSIQQGEIRAPAAGRIVRLNRFAGEYAEPATPIVELLVEGSTEMVLYVPQSDADSFRIGRLVTVNVNPSNTNVSCRVHRVALEMQKAPEALARHYMMDESLLPVYLRAEDGKSLPPTLALGSELRLPRANNTSAISRLREWWGGQPSVDPEMIASPALPSDPALPVRTVSEQEPTELNADEPLEADGRTARWLPRGKADQRIDDLILAIGAEISINPIGRGHTSEANHSTRNPYESVSHR